MARTGRFSFSRMTTFEQCARRYRYRYLDGVKEAFQSVEAFMGTTAHSTLEWLWTERLAGREPRLEDAVGYYCAEWDRTIGASRAPIKVIRRDTQLESYRRNGADMVADFYRDQFMNDRLETIELERHFEIQLDGRIAFQGFIDRLAKSADGVLQVIDYKTGKRVPSRFEGKDAQQLEAYAVAMFAELDVTEIDLTLHYLRTGKPVSRRIAVGEARAIETRLCARIDAAVAATVFPPVTSPLCDWCGFNDICDAPRERRPARRAGRA